MVGFQRLEVALGTALAGEACFDAATRAAYASDASNYRQDVRWRAAPATRCAGRACAAVVIDCSKYLDAELLAPA
jgi:hypothetical protein